MVVWKGWKDGVMELVHTRGKVLQVPAEEGRGEGQVRRWLRRGGGR